MLWWLILFVVTTCGIQNGEAPETLPRARRSSTFETGPNSSQDYSEDFSGLLSAVRTAVQLSGQLVHSWKLITA